MRKMILPVLSVTLLLVSMPVTAATGEAGSWEVGPYGGYAWIDDYSPTFPGNDWLYGVRVGYHPVPKVGLELSWQRIDGEANFIGALESGPNTTVESWRLNLLWEYRPGETVQPFFTFGGGRQSFELEGFGEDIDLEYNIGGGFRWMWTDHFGLRFDARWNSARMDIPDTQRENNIESALGLSWVLGGGPPRDTDGDGVPDRKDDCPDTPRGATVDAKGCPSDSDGDGVLNGLDKCPDTPKGWPVDSVGCPLDTDGDGVADGADACPDTPRGAKVDAKGCPTDSDGDGVYDGIDTCPNTPKGAKVDARGCPLDGDGDGVWDGLDKCPNTPRGDKVDAQGCTIAPPKAPPLFEAEKRTLILEGVNFDSDKADIKPEAAAILDKVAASLRDWPEVRVEVGGHTDSTNTAAHNLDLSRRRAESVKNYLVAKGIDASRLSAKGYGEERPIVDNKTVEGRAKNRRVELTRID